MRRLPGKGEGEVWDTPRVQARLLPQLHPLLAKQGVQIVYDSHHIARGVVGVIGCLFGSEAAERVVDHTTLDTPTVRMLG